MVYRQAYIYPMAYEQMKSIAFQHMNPIPYAYIHIYIYADILPPPPLIVYIHICICHPPTLKAHFANSCSKTLFSLFTLAATNKESHVMKERQFVSNQSSKYFTNTGTHTFALRKLSAIAAARCSTTTIPTTTHAAASK